MRLAHLVLALSWSRGGGTAEEERKRVRMTRRMLPGIFFMLIANFFGVVLLHGVGALRAVSRRVVPTAATVATAATTAAGANTTAARTGFA